MNTRKILIATMAVSLVAVPAMAQTRTGTEQNRPDYIGGPKSDIPDNIGQMEPAGSNPTAELDGDHHYDRGPKTDIPPDMSEMETTGNTTGNSDSGHHVRPKQ
jgi:hypothetical protein